MTVYQIDPVIDIDEFTKEITADITDLTEAMRTQTARTAYYGMLYAKAQKQANHVKLNLRAIEATLTTKVRKELVDAANDIAEAEGTKPERITADMVKAAVVLKPTMLNWLKVQLETDEIEQVCRIAYDAFKTRRDMIQSLGHMSRAEMNALGRQSMTAADNIRDYRDRRAARAAKEE